MEQVTVYVERNNGEDQEKSFLQKYFVPKEEKATVLQALMYIYDEIDETLAFRYACRQKKCGLCAVEVNDKARMACTTSLTDEVVIKPLSNLPFIRDLVIDRRWLYTMSKELQLFIPKTKGIYDLQVIIEPEKHRELMKCIECLACFSGCPFFRCQDSSFVGPYFFVKLAQLHFDPRNKVDRRSQAQELGIEHCRNCRKCYCINGVPLRMALKALFT